MGRRNSDPGPMPREMADKARREPRNGTPGRADDPAELAARVAELTKRTRKS